MDRLYWSWGMTSDRNQWFIRVQDLDTNEYAVAYYDSDESNPLRIYESRDPELLSLVILAEDTDIYTTALEMKNMLQQIDEFDNAIENATVANFM